MNSKSNNGFTMVEILVAVAIVAAIVSMVYGSYFATSKSTQAYSAGMTVSRQCQRVLGQIAKQIRCSYAGTNAAKQEKSIFRQKRTATESKVNYFYANPDDPAGQILQLVTTNSFGRNQANGLIEAVYKLDKRKGSLYLSERKFTGSGKTSTEKRNWQLVTENVSHLELAFFDGQQWQKNWNFKSMKELPYAVRISITCEDKNNRQYQCQTVAGIYCQKNRPGRRENVS